MTISKTSEAELWREYQRCRSDAARNAIVERYLPEVEGIANKLHGRLPRFIDRNDLFSDGVIGLMAAVKTFDPNRGVKFAIYLVMRVRGAMLDGLRDRDHISRHMRQKGNEQKHVKLRNDLPDAGQQHRHDAIILGDWLKHINRQLCRRDRLIVMLLSDGMSQAEISKVLGVSACRVSQLVDCIRQRLLAVGIDKLLEQSAAV